MPGGLSRRWRGALIALVALGTIAGTGVGAAYWLLDPEGLKARLIGAVLQATGRQLTVAGKIGIGFSLAPTVTLDDVTLANPPGYSRPEMFHAERVEVRLVLLPLLSRRIEIARIRVLKPDIRLETDPSGLGNWLVARPVVASRLPPAPPSRPPAPAAPPPASSSPQAPAGTIQEAARRPAPPSRPVVHEILLEDGVGGWRDGVTGRQARAAIPRVIISLDPEGGVHAEGTLDYQGQSVAVRGQIGTLSPFAIGTHTHAWPVSARLAAGHTEISLMGHAAYPLTDRVWRMTADAFVPNPVYLAPFLPRAASAPLDGVTVHAEARDGPILSKLSVRAEHADLTGLLHGVRGKDLTLEGDLTGPIRVSGLIGNAQIGVWVAGTIGDLAWLNAGAPAPVPIALSGSMGSTRGSLSGLAGGPNENLSLSLDIPDPALLCPWAPPGVKSVALRMGIGAVAGGLPFRLTSSAGDISGALTISSQPRLTISGALTSAMLDLDAAWMPIPTAVRPPVPTPQILPGPRVNKAPMPEAARADPLAAPSAARATGPLIPDQALPFALLRAADADLRFHLDRVRWNRTYVTGIDGDLALHDGMARIDPLTIAAPDLMMSALVEADAARDPARVHVALHAPALAARPLMALLSMRQVADGAITVNADLTGTGGTAHQLAASANGWAGVAVQDGTLDVTAMNAWLDVLRPLRLDGAGATDLNCFGFGATMKDGVASIRSLALSTAPLVVEGGGEIDLGREDVSLRLRPRAKVGGTGVAVPVRVTGPLRAPAAKMDLSTGGAGGLLAGLLLGGKGTPAGPDPCPDALAQGRAEGEKGARLVPEVTPRSAPLATPSVSAAVDLLNWLNSRSEDIK